MHLKANNDNIMLISPSTYDQHERTYLCFQFVCKLRLSNFLERCIPVTPLSVRQNTAVRPLLISSSQASAHSLLLMVLQYSRVLETWSKREEGVAELTSERERTYANNGNNRKHVSRCHVSRTLALQTRRLDIRSKQW